jgi:hypothetical protein
MNEREGELKRKAKLARKAVDENFGDDLNGRLRSVNQGPHLRTPNPGLYKRGWTPG